MISFTIYLQWLCILEWEKKSEMYKKRKQGKIPRLVALPFNPVEKSAPTTLYFHYLDNGEHKALWFCGGGEGSGHALSILSKRSELATFADPFNKTIYRQTSIPSHATFTKMPHLLCEQTWKWIEGFLKIKLYLHLNYVLMLNWILWNGTVLDIETVLIVNRIV